MHSRKHGKHGSKKPVKKIKLDWLIYDKDEVENLIVKLSKEGLPSAKIGTILRDQYGVPDVRYFNLRITKVTEKVAKKEVPEDMYNLMKQAVNLHRHMVEKRKDSKAKHGLELIESKIRRLGKYYSRTGKIPKTWKYNVEAAKLLVK
jgi:small subunit ribosomal protein S15